MSTRRSPGLLRRLILQLLFTAGSVLWLSRLTSARLDFPFPLMLGLVVAATGLAAGFGARLAFGGRSRLLQVVAAVAAGALGLYGLGYLTGWKMGIGPIEFWRDEVDKLEAAQLGGASFAALLAVSAWRRQVRLRRASGRPAAAPASLAVSPHSASGPTSRGLAGMFRPAAGVRRAARSVRPAASHRSGSPSRPAERKLTLRTAAARPGARRRGVFRRRPEVQFSVYEEHKCPYCLEEVKRNDPRGVQECSICHTLHHADCWAITGMCQVPHLTT